MRTRGFEGFEGEDERGFEGLEGERRGASPESSLRFRRMRSKNEIQKKRFGGGWNLEEVPSLSSSKRNNRPSKDKKLRGGI